VCVCVCVYTYTHKHKQEQEEGSDMMNVEPIRVETPICVHACECPRVWVCSLAHPACNAYVPYCDIICGPSGSITFFDIIHKLHDFQKKVAEHKMCVLIFSTAFI
jgi:hypothetical protein